MNWNRCHEVEEHVESHEELRDNHGAGTGRSCMRTRRRIRGDRKLSIPVVRRRGEVRHDGNDGEGNQEARDEPVRYPKQLLRLSKQVGGCGRYPEIGPLANEPAGLQHRAQRAWHMMLLVSHNRDHFHEVVKKQDRLRDDEDHGTEALERLVLPNASILLQSLPTARTHESARRPGADSDRDEEDCDLRNEHPPQERSKERHALQAGFQISALRSAVDLETTCRRTDRAVDALHVAVVVTMVRLRFQSWWLHCFGNRHIMNLAFVRYMAPRLQRHCGLPSAAIPRH